MKTELKKLTYREIRELAKMRICYILLNRVPEMSTGDLATRILGTLEEEFKYRIYIPAFDGKETTPP